MISRLLGTVLIGLLLLSCSIPRPLIEQIKESGVLHVITRNSPTTYYLDNETQAGFEYELVSLFAEELGVEVNFIIPDSFDQIIPMIQKGEAHLAAAGLTVTDARKSKVRFSPGYMEITQQLVYLHGHKRPKDITQTNQGILEVIAGSSHEEELQRLREGHPDLQWNSQQEVEVADLLYLVKQELIDYTIADSNDVAINRRFYPGLQVAFNLTDPQPMAWAFQHAEDSSLYRAAEAFINRVKADGTLEHLIEKYYGYVENLGFVDNRTFRRHMLQRLPPLLPFFEQAAELNAIDWKLLAAIGYQESHWNPEAVSPTGVKGIMMLTRATARQMEIEDRRDPEQSILGGARYVRLMEEMIPDRIEEPDRIWLALAGYNVGFGHLEDARILTERHGANPDKWVDVKEYLPLLSQKKYYSTLKRGYARGREPVIYVDNIRNYYDMLKFHLANQESESGTGERRIQTTTPAVL